MTESVIPLAVLSLNKKKLESLWKNTSALTVQILKFVSHLEVSVVTSIYLLQTILDKENTEKGGTSNSNF